MIRKKKKKRNPAYIHDPLVLDKSEYTNKGNDGRVFKKNLSHNDSIWSPLDAIMIGKI